MKCYCCGTEAEHAFTEHVGKPPADPKLHGTKADTSSVRVKPFCGVHWAALQDFIQERVDG